MSTPDCQLYLVTPPTIDPTPFADTLALALDAGDVACVQLRLKDIDDDALRHTIDVLRPVVQDRDIAFILNDRPDLAAETGCDGVHIGQDDMPYKQARNAMGGDAIVGVTCHASKHHAIVAGEQGADYVAFGAFFPTTTKEPKEKAETDILEWWSSMMTIPCVAIGGITVENCAPLITAGADFLAVVSGVWDYKDGPAAAVKAFNDTISDVTGGGEAA